MLSLDEEINKYQNYAHDAEEMCILRFLIEKKQKMIKTHGVLLLTPKNNWEIKRIKDYIKVIDNMQWANINNDGNERLLIRTYDKLPEDSISLDEMRDEARKMFNRKEYSKALSKRLEVIFYEETVPIRDYYNVAMCYYRMHNFPGSYKYFTIVDAIALDFGIDLDLGEYLDKSKQKQFIGEKIREKNETLDDGLKELIIIDVIDNNEPLDDTLNKYSLDEEAKLLMMVKLAKEYYRRGFIMNGDRLLKNVERSTNKTSNVINALDRIRKNKQLIIAKGSK